MINPKATFQQNAAYKGWQDVCDSPVFHAAAQASIALMLLNKPSAPDLGTAAALHHRMEGAKEFLAILSSLSLPPEIPKKIPNRNLTPT